MLVLNEVETASHGNSLTMDGVCILSATVWHSAISGIGWGIQLLLAAQQSVLGGSQKQAGNNPLMSVFQLKANFSLTVFLMFLLGESAEETEERKCASEDATQCDSLVLCLLTENATWFWMSRIGKQKSKHYLPCSDNNISCDQWLLSMISQDSHILWPLDVWMNSKLLTSHRIIE